MRFALYYPWVYLRGGAERLLLETIKRSDHEWVLYTNHFEPQHTFPEFSDIEVRQLGNVTVRRDIPHVVAAGLTISVQRIDDGDIDAALVLSEGLGNLSAGRFAAPTLCLCLTPLKVAYEQVTRDRFYEHGGRIHYRAAFAGFRALDRRTWRHYEHVLCISEEVRRRILDNGLVEGSRLAVAHPGVDLDAFTPSVRQSSRTTFLLAGRIMWQKHIELGLEAWRWFKPHPDDNPFRLVIAGMVDEKSVSYLAALTESVRWRHDIEFVVTPSDGELLTLYQSCRAAVFTAPNEDFGLVPLEAMACGKPVIAQARGGPLETLLHGETGLLIDGTPAAYAEALAAFAGLDHLALDDIARRCRCRAEQFSWENFVRTVDAHMEAATRAGAAKTTAPARDPVFAGGGL
jgi:glycosyltransferase involved in cell wall biosynthesis